MANNIKGITIEIGGDTTGLDKALKGVNSQARNAQAELKEVDKALKLDPSNVELLEQKQRALADAVAATAEKLDILKDAQRQAQDQLERGEISQQQYDALTREIVKTEDALKKAKTASDNFSVSLEQAKVAAGRVADAAQKVADKTKGLSAAAAGVVTAIGGAAYKAAQTADELNTLSKQTGISTDDLQKMAYAADLVDVSVDTIAGSMTKLRKGMASSSKSVEAAFSAIGVATRDADGQLRDSNEVFYEVLEGLSQIANETERDTLAMEIFGRSADQLAPIIDDGGAALRELGQEAQDLGIILDEETLNSLNEVNDSVDRLKARATGEIAKAGAKAMETLAPVLDGIIDKVSTLLDWIGNLDEEQLKTIMTVAAVVAAISPIAGLIASISGAISTFLTIWPQVKAAGAAVSAFAAANPVLLIVTAVAGLAIAIAANWDKIRPILEALWEKIKTVAENVKAKIEGVVEGIKGIFQGLKDGLAAIWDGIKQGIADKINAIIGFINNLIEKVNGFLSLIGSNGIVQGIAGFFGMKLGQLQTIPMLAGGGQLTQGSAIVGDGGPELLTMQNGRADVQPITTSTTTYNTINQTSRQPVQVNVVLDRMVMARALYDPMREVAVEHGPSAVR